MKRNDFNPSFDDLMTLDRRILWGACDFWAVNQDGVPHRLSAGYNGEKWTVKVPALIPMKHKGRKLTSMIVYCNACDTVTYIEAHYGPEKTLVFRGPEFTQQAVNR